MSAGVSLADIVGIGAAEAAGPPGTGGAPGYNYKIKNGQIYDSANVAVSPTSVQEHILRNEAAIKNNQKSADFSPKLVEFANSDLEAQNAAMRKLLEQLGGVGTPEPKIKPAAVR